MHMYMYLFINTRKTQIIRMLHGTLTKLTINENDEQVTNRKIK